MEYRAACTVMMRTFLGASFDFEGLSPKTVMSTRWPSRTGFFLWFGACNSVSCLGECLGCMCGGCKRLAIPGPGLFCRFRLWSSQKPFSLYMYLYMYLYGICILQMYLYINKNKQNVYGIFKEATNKIVFEMFFCFARQYALRLAGMRDLEDALEKKSLDQVRPCRRALGYCRGLNKFTFHGLI